MAETKEKLKQRVEDLPGFRHLVRVASTDLEGKKSVLYALTKIKGVDISFANAVLSVTDVPKDKKAGILDESDVNKLNKVFENPASHKIPEWMYNRRKDYETGEDVHILSGSLDFTKENDIKRLKKTKSNRGMRHAWNLPLRGQRTKSNFRKNKKKLSGSKKRR